MKQADKLRKQELLDLIDAVKAADWGAVNAIALVSIKNNTRKTDWCEALREVMSVARWADKNIAEPHEDMGSMADSVKVWLHEQMCIGQVMKVVAELGAKLL